METNCNLTIVIKCMVDLFLFVLWEGHKPNNFYALIKQMRVCIECCEEGQNIVLYQWYSVTGIISLACFPTGVAPHFSLTFAFCIYHAINTTVCCTKEVPKVWYYWEVWFHEQIKFVPYNKHNCTEQTMFSVFTAAFVLAFLA